MKRRSFLKAIGAVAAGIGGVSEVKADPELLRTEEEADRLRLEHAYKEAHPLLMVNDPSFKGAWHRAIEALSQPEYLCRELRAACPGAEVSVWMLPSHRCYEVRMSYGDRWIADRWETIDQRNRPGIVAKFESEYRKMANRR